jgi:hypothetical protein
MMHIRRVLTMAAAVAALAAASPALVAQQQQQQPQQNNQQNRREQERRSQQEQRDIEALVQLVDAVSAGKQPAPTDITVNWQSNHFVKGSDNGTYIPYTLNVGGAPNPNVALYVRAVDKNAAPAAAPAPQQNNNNRNQQAAAPMYPWDDINFIQVPAGGKVQRALMLTPGQYDRYVAVRERTPAQQQRNAPPLKAGVLTHTLTVPDYNSTTDITTSTPILAQSVEPLASPLNAEEMRANPYTFGGTLKVTPAESTVFKTADDFQLLFWIYGVGDKGGVPDVTIEYNFHVKNPDGTEKFFNKTQPQTLNSTTLPPGFNVQAGHQVLGFLGVPLKSFPAGEYRVEYKITDKISGKTLTQNTTFTVQA